MCAPILPERNLFISSRVRVGRIAAALETPGRILAFGNRQAIISLDTSLGYL
jgi:hypothetical protein